MAMREQFQAMAADPLLVQAERVLSQRQARHMVIDPDVLGEPGWDILLCAYIAHRKGNYCRLDAVASEIGLNVQTTKRWVDLLTLRELLIQRNDLFAISDDAEVKISSLFSRQINEMLQALGLDPKQR